MKNYDLLAKHCPEKIKTLKASMENPKASVEIYINRLSPDSILIECLKQEFEMTPEEIKQWAKFFTTVNQLKHVQT